MIKLPMYRSNHSVIAAATADSSASTPDGTTAYGLVFIAFEISHYIASEKQKVLEQIHIVGAK